MALPVTSNISSLTAQRNLQKSTLAVSKSLERLSSGLRINNAGDDAAGLAISEGLRSQIRGINQAVRNSNDGLSLIGTAESAINSYTDILQRLRELAVQSANDTNSATNRAAINEESNQLLDELQRIATTVEFNGTKLLDGTFTAKQLQVGAQAHQTISINTGNLRTNQIGMVAQATTGVLPTTNALATGNLYLNGVDVGASVDDLTSSVNPSGSAIAIAKAINNNTAMHGVTAEAQPATVTGVATIAGGTFDSANHQLTINGIPIFSGTVVISADDAGNTLRDMINSKINQTGVRASLNSSKQLVLTADDGRNIQVVTTGALGTGGGIADELGLAAAAGNVNSITGGTVRLTSPNDIIVTGTQPGYAGLPASATYTRDPNTALNRLTMTTAAGATTAIDIVDNALEHINKIRAGLGAITNRLEHTIQNLQSISENLSASDSRIRDADFAVETAALTRNQILQQAGTAILGQANTTTQSALQLLKQ